MDIDWSRELSIVIIHVEIIIGVLKQKYTILQSTIPICLINDGNDSNTTMDKIVQVSCALVNLCPSVVYTTKLNVVLLHNVSFVNSNS